MPSSPRTLYVGVVTTFAILTVGFSGATMIANSASTKPPVGYQSHVTAQTSPVRVILPTTAEAAQPPQPGAAAPRSTSALQPLSVQTPVENEVRKADMRRAQADEERSRSRYAERKSRKIAEARARQRMAPREAAQSVLAFSGAALW